MKDRISPERAVSPVIGITLLVAIVVILAAVVGVMALEFDSNPDPAPVTTFSYEHLRWCSTGGESIRVSHHGGERIHSDHLLIRHRQVLPDQTPPSADGATLLSELNRTARSDNGDGSFQTGDGAYIGHPRSNLSFEDAEVDIVWKGAGRTYLLSSWEGDSKRDSDRQCASLRDHGLGQFEDPETKPDCKGGGWTNYGFDNQGLCIQYVNTGIDSRDDPPDDWLS